MLSRNNFKNISDEELLDIALNNLSLKNIKPSNILSDEFSLIENNPHKNKKIIDIVLEVLTELNKQNLNINLLKELNNALICKTVIFKEKIPNSSGDGYDIFLYHKQKFKNFKIEYDINNKKDFDVLDFILKFNEDENLLILKEKLLESEKEYKKYLSPEHKKLVEIPLNIDIEKINNFDGMSPSLVTSIKQVKKQLIEELNKYKQIVDEVNFHVSTNSESYLNNFINKNVSLKEIDFSSIPPVKGEEDILNAMEWIELILDKGLIKPNLISFDKAIECRIRYGLSKKRNLLKGIFGKFVNLTPKKVAGIILEFKKRNENKNPPYVFGGFVFNSIEEAKRVFIDLIHASFVTYDEKEEDDIQAEPEIDLEKGKKGLEFFEKNFPETKEELNKFENTYKHYQYLLSNEGKSLYKCEVGKDSIEWIVEFNKTKKQLNDIYTKDIIEKIGINKIIEQILKIKCKLRIVKGINDKDKPASDYKLDVDFVICEGNFRNTNISQYSSNVFIFPKVRKVSLEDVKNNKKIKVIHNKNRKQSDSKVDQKTFMQVKTFDLLNKKFPPKKEWSEDVKLEGYESHWSMAESMISNITPTDKEIVICFPTLPYSLMNECKIVFKNGKRTIELGPTGKKLSKIMTQASKDKYNYLKKEVQEYCNKLKNKDLNGRKITVYRVEKEELLKPEKLNYIRKLLGMIDSLADINEEETTKSFILSEFSKQKKKGMYNNDFCIIEAVENKEPTMEDLFMFKPSFDLFDYWEKVAKHKYWEKYKDWMPEVDWEEIDFLPL